ncbi:ectomycorrhiza-regulated protein [Lentinula raphanica]|nr:ectomycorrhiza-regulated protein [Lentinula raphanica]
MYHQNYSHYVSEVGTNTTPAAIYQHPSPHQMSSSGYSTTINAGRSTYGPGPTRNPPTIAAHAPPLRAASTRRYSPESLLGPDAPTQPRNYVTPSATSRKEIPSYFIKQQRRATPPQSHGMSDDEDDELTEEPPAENATDQEKIDYKRRQNTLAARRSRKRKLMYTQQLEATVERLTAEKELWRTRALTLRQLLRSHNIPYGEFND